MKLFRLTILAIVAIATFSCTESIPKDNSSEFAAKVAHDIYYMSINPIITDIALIHKANNWLQCTDNEKRFEIEDQYFSSIAPRTEENTVQVITHYSDKIDVIHNNIPLTETGAKWYIESEDTFNGNKITAENTGNQRIDVTIEESNGEAICSMVVLLQDVDQYVIEFEMSQEYYFPNSPITMQHIYTKSPVAFSTPNKTPYTLNYPLSITDGRIAIQLLTNEAESATANDIITLSFKDSSADFNPLIEYHKNIFYYDEVFAMWY